MNLLDLVPQFNRHLRQYRKSIDTDSTLAAYLADAVQALSHKWSRTYTVTFTEPATYTVSPDIDSGDVRTVVLMASVIYKMATFSSVRFSDGDFSYDPTSVNPIAVDMSELNTRVPPIKLASGSTAPMRGFNNIYNRENYDWAFVLDLML